MPKPNDATPTIPVPVKPLPNQMALPFDADEARRQAELFDAGHSLPGVAERGQRIFWDVDDDR